MIYLDHNATTPLAPCVLEAMLPYLTERYGNPSSPTRFGHESRRAVEDARQKLADLVGCNPDELIFCSSGTEADNLALRGVVEALGKPGAHIITSAIEHPAVLATSKALSDQGYRVTYVPVTADGVLDLPCLLKSLRDDTILISVMRANNETGVLQPLDQIAAIAQARGILLHTDAVQTAGKLPESLSRLGASLVSFSAHKFHGPKGVAALFVRRGTPLRAVMTGGSQERARRSGTENVAGIVGMATALSLAQEQVEEEALRLERLRDAFEERVCSILPRVTINGKSAPRVPNTSNLTFEGVDGESVVLGLDLLGICAATGSACSTGDPEPSHVLRAMGLEPRQAQGSVRISLGRDTSEANLETVVGALKTTVARLRRVSSIDNEQS